MPNITSHFRRDEAGATYERVEQKLEPVMLLLSFLFLPVFAAPLLVEISDESARGLSIAGWIIWGTFILEYLWLVALAPHRAAWVKSHKLDALIILLPFLRPLRFLRVLRLATATSGMARAWVAVRRIGGRAGFQPFFKFVGIAILIGAAFVLVFEHEQPGASINDFGTALWWAIVTCTTVGYGDHFPVTDGGKVVAVILMLIGIAGLSLLTASVAALFVEEDDNADAEDVRARLQRIETLLMESSSRHE